MKIIYIRHGEDQKSKHVHDEKLTKEAKYEIEELTEKLIREHGVPDIIYYSPFHRTRYTAKYMIKKIVKMKERGQIENKKVRFQSEPQLGRFFTRKQKDNPQVRDSTMKKGIIVEERWSDFKDRIELQMNTILDRGEEIVWNVSHSLVLLQVAKLNRIGRDKRVEYLDFVVLDK